METLVDPAINATLAFYRGYLKVFAGSDAARVLSRPSPVRNTGFDLDLDVLVREEVATDVVALTLGGSAPLPSWTPGAHLDVFLPSGAQRQYSLCGDPSDRSTYRIAVRLVRDGGGGSREVHESVRAGDRLRVRGPRQAFWMVAEPAYLFVAGGIGITPILPMVRAAARNGADWKLVYLGRSRATLPFLDELAEYGDRVSVRTDDELGPPDLAAALEGAAPGTAVYMCGPGPLMDTAKELQRRRDPGARFHSERFSPPPVRGGEPFAVRVASTGAEVMVGAEETTLQALGRVVPALTYSCQQGFCGTCKLRVLDGDVEHRDQRLLDAERADHFLPCVSRAAGTLVVDL
ncbi:MAG TPA: PDR/VanB family oxidoreductase [Nocardioides sp.]|nr:PDR/VanB family oxidoreductase [Nocardioides sp.]